MVENRGGNLLYYLLYSSAKYFRGSLSNEYFMQFQSNFSKQQVLLENKHGAYREI